MYSLLKSIFLQVRKQTKNTVRLGQVPRSIVLSRIFHKMGTFVIFQIELPVLGRPLLVVQVGTPGVCAIPQYPAL